MVCGHEIVTECAALMRRLDEFILEAEAQVGSGDRRRIERREIRTDHVQVYIRTGLRGVPDTHRMAMTFCLADITIDEDYRSRGILHLTMAWLEQRQPLDGIYVENVINERLAFFLERRGYTSFPTAIARPGRSWWRRHPLTVPLV